MANLLNQNIGTNYKGILNLNTLNGNLSGTLQAVTDGDGNASPLTLSTGEVGISRTIALSAGSSNVRLINETYTINNTGAQTGNVTGIFLNATETALNGMSHNVMDLQVGGFPVFRVSRAGLVTTGSSIFCGLNMSVAAGGAYIISSRGFLGAAADGVWTLYDSSAGSFGRLQLGGTTNAFPAIKRNGAAIDFRLADDSGFAAINSAGINANGLIGEFAFSQYWRLVSGGQTFGYYLSGNQLSCTSSFLVGGTTANQLLASAQLQVDSTTKGFLPPRMTTTQVNAISSPATGLVVYSTTENALCLYNGSSWRKLNDSPL